MYHRSFNYVLIIYLFLFAFTYTAAQAQGTKETEQVDRLLKEKGSRTAAERKINSQLLQAIKEYSGDKDIQGMGLEPVAVRTDKDGNLMVDINAAVTDELLNSIRALGGKIIYPSKQYHTIRAQVPILVVEKIAACEAVKFIKPAAIPVTRTQ